jgi:hypothetical protein
LAGQGGTITRCPQQEGTRPEIRRQWATRVKTSLSRLGIETSARLLRHAYALAAMNPHVFLDMPLVDIPPLDEFEEMCR